MGSYIRRILLKNTVVGGGQQLSEAATPATLYGKECSLFVIDDIGEAAIERGGEELIADMLRNAARRKNKESGKGKNKRDRANKYGSPFGKKRG